MLKLLEKFGLRRNTTTARAEMISTRHSISSGVIWDWPQDEPIRVDRALALYPELAESNHAMLDIAIEEFADRRHTPDELTATLFADQFPEFRTALMDALVVEQFLSEHPEWFDDILSTNHSPDNIDWPVVGEKIAGFRLIDNLGSGGFSRVFLAEDLAYPDRLVAVKFCSNVTHEATALANLHHNAIGVVYSVQRIENRNLCVICMAFKTRTTLHRVIRKVWSDRRPTKAAKVWEEVASANKLDRTNSPEWAKQSLVDWVMDFAAELARGLEASHEMKIIHCDLKPSNVMIDREGRPTLVDFNVAFQKDALASPGNIGGTLPYMAPEQIRAFAGQGYSDVGPLTDVYGFGATMYELLTGRVPFAPAASADDGIRALLEMRKIEPQPIRDFNASVDPDLERLVMSCLAYDMQARPRSAKVVATELDFLRKRTLVQGTPTEWWRTRRVLGTVAAIAILIAVAIGPFSQATRETGAAPLSEPAPQSAVVGTDRKSLPVGEVTESQKLALAYTASGYDALDAGDIEESVKLFEKARHLDGRHVGAKLGFIRALIAARDYQDAINELNPLRVEKPIGEIAALQAYCLALMNSYELAINASVRAQELGMVTPEVMSNHAYFLASYFRPIEAVPIANQAVRQFGRPTRANMVAVIAHMRCDVSAWTWDPQFVASMLCDLPDSAEKYNLESLSYLAFGMRDQRDKNLLGYEKNCRLALNSLVTASSHGLSDSWYASLVKSGLSTIQQERVVAEGLFPNASQMPSEGRDPRQYLFDPIKGTKLDRYMNRSFKEALNQDDVAESNVAKIE